MTKQQLIEDNMKLVYWVVSREFPTLTQDEDIIQTGMVGLCMAAERYDETIGTFAGFAYSCIRNTISKELRNRKKHYGVISLDYEIVADNGERTPMVELIMGDEDVAYVDVSVDLSRLTEQQQKIYQLLVAGVEPIEIAQRLNTTVQNVSWTKRKIRLLRKHAERKE